MGVSEPAHRAPQPGGRILRGALAQVQKLLPPFPRCLSRRPAPPPRQPSPPECCEPHRTVSPRHVPRRMT
eukprot:349904-Prymnesium_polylepis.1